MLICQGKIHRNLQEQVVKNMEDIEFILKQRGVLNEYGLRIVEVAEYLPSVNDYKTANAGWQYGDTILVGEDAPYSAYILTRANGSHSTDYWFEIGDVPGTFTSVAATVGANVGTPTVTVTYADGGVSFAFDNLKGDQGPEGGTEVIANPETTGTEDSLTSIKIDGTKYTVGSGASDIHLYGVAIASDVDANESLIPLLLPVDNISTGSALATWLYNNGYTSYSNGYPFFTSGMDFSTAWNSHYYYLGLYSSNGSTLSSYAKGVFPSAIDTSNGRQTFTGAFQGSAGKSFSTQTLYNVAIRKIW